MSPPSGEAGREPEPGPGAPGAGHLAYTAVRESCGPGFSLPEPAGGGLTRRGPVGGYWHLSSRLLQSCAGPPRLRFVQRGPAYCVTTSEPSLKAFTDTAVSDAHLCGTRGHFKLRTQSHASGLARICTRGRAARVAGVLGVPHVLQAHSISSSFVFVFS